VRLGSAFDGPLERLAWRAAAVSAGVLVAVALAGASVRVLPWLLDPQIPWRVAVPFGRAVASVAMEAAVLVGWPVGWALAAFTLCERGEGRVLATLGERPIRSALRLVPMGLVFGAVLGTASLAGGRDASEPGRILADLLHAGRVSCERASSPGAVHVPLVGVSWLCGAGEPILAGRAPGGHGGNAARDVLYTAHTIALSSDARRIDLEGASLASRAGTLHAGHAVFLLPPFVRASSLPVPARALLLAAAGLVSGVLAAWLLLVLEQKGLSLWRLHALALGAAGPVGCLGLLHALERAEKAPPLAYGLLPVSAGAATLVVALLVWSLPGVRAPGTR
jgi:hypothetical protein